MKCCTKCAAYKPDKDFELRNPVTGARRAQCRQCRNAPGRRGRIARKSEEERQQEAIDPAVLSAAFASFMLASAAHQVAGGNPPASVNAWPVLN